MCVYGFSPVRPVHSDELDTCHDLLYLSKLYDKQYCIHRSLLERGSHVRQQEVSLLIFGKR